MKVKKALSASLLMSIVTFGALVSAQPANDNCSSATPITEYVATAFSTFAATNEAPLSCRGTADIWFVWTATISGTVGVNLSNVTLVAGTGTNTNHSVYLDPGGGLCPIDGDNVACIDPLTGTFTATMGESYLIRIGAFSTTSGAQFDGSLVITTTEICDDGFDNDADGLTDCADSSDCGGESSCQEGANCGDGIDNDVDGLTDCADSDCSGEAPCIEDCQDGIDNDTDGLTDCADQDCAGDPACPEAGNCSDGIDNDNDGDIDCADSECIGVTNCIEVCTDGIDNDADGLIDCADTADCGVVSSCLPPDNDDCSSPTLIPVTGFGSYGVVVSTSGATDSLAPGSTVPCGGPFPPNATAKDVWFEFTTTAAGLLDINSCDPGGIDGIAGFDIEIIVYTGSCGSLVDVACNGNADGSNDGLGGSCQNWFAHIPPFAVDASTTYLIRFGGYNSQSFGTNEIQILYGVQDPEDCDDGVDNDFNGLTDCADIADCLNAPNCLESGNCNDGLDNDSDGLTDCFDSSDCLTASNCLEGGLCDDLIDNDSDGQIDCDDTDCIGDLSCPNTNDLCIDAITIGIGQIDFNNISATLDGPNDGDPNMDADVWFLHTATGDGQLEVSTCGSSGTLQNTVLIVYDAASGCPIPGDSGLASDDDGCPGDQTSVLSISVFTGYQVLIQAGGWNGATGTSTLTLSLQETGNCEDGVDNDLDGLTDCADPDCTAEAHCIENCEDGVDNDVDGLIDCADTADCVSAPNCLESGNCDDGLDNDADGLIDCLDTVDCDAFCLESANCGDGLDNDGDGAIDCFDSDCTNPAFAFSVIAPPELCQAFSLIAEFILDAPSEGIRGFSFGVCHDPGILSVTQVSEGAAILGLNGGDGPDFFTVDVFADGFSIGCIASITDPDLVIGPGLNLTLATAEYSGDAPGTTEIAFCNSIGNPPVNIAAIRGIQGGTNSCPILTGHTLEVVNCVNDECSDAIALTIPVQPGLGWNLEVPFDTTSATSSTFPAPPCSDPGLGNAENDVWFSYTPTYPGLLAVTACGTPGFEIDMIIYEGDCSALPGSLTTVGCSGDTTACPLGASKDLRVAAGVTYLLRIGGSSATDVGVGTLAFLFIPHIVCQTAGPLQPGLNSFDNTIAPFNIGVNEGPLCGSTDWALWYVYSAPGPGDLLLETCGLTALDTTVAVFEVPIDFVENFDDQDTPCSDGAPEVGCNDDSPTCPGGASHLTVAVEPNQHYLIMVATAGQVGTGGLFAEFVPEDCQPNGIPDFDEIQQGLVEDWDENGVPDDCQDPTLLFRFSSSDLSIPFTPGSGQDLEYTVPFFLEERPANQGFPNELEGFTLQVELSVPSNTVGGSYQLSPTLLMLNEVLGVGQGPDFFQVDECDGTWRVGVINSLSGNPDETFVANGPTLVLEVQVLISSPNYLPGDLPIIGSVRSVDGMQCFALAVNNSVIQQSSVVPTIGFEASIEIYELQGSGEFIRGDCNLDGGEDIGDVIKGLGILFSGDPLGTCLVACDTNDDETVDIADAIFQLSMLFPGPMPPSPVPPLTCGADPTAGPIECLFSPVCP